MSYQVESNVPKLPQKKGCAKESAESNNLKKFKSESTYIVHRCITKRLETQRVEARTALTCNAVTNANTGV